MAPGANVMLGATWSGSRTAGRRRGRIGPQARNATAGRPQARNAIAGRPQPRNATAGRPQAGNATAGRPQAC
ncbi:MAG TPA: hypothetical protein VN767_10610 [Streptosporangiaceae bacterium]|nr:hypothetical protein [Streptosporangiaceae bacterium]